MSGRENIRRVFEAADSIDREEGLIAYLRYRDVMTRLAAFYDYPLDRVVAAFAALSPNNDYIGNLRSCATLLAGHREGKTPDAIISSAYGHCKVRAYSYIAGEADFLETVRGKKIRAFYQNILNPLDPRPVTIDGHAINVWRGERATLKSVVRSSYRYDEIAQDYRAEAREQGILPNQMQAVCWFAWKRLHKIYYNPQLSLLNAGDHWGTVKLPEEIRLFTPKTKAGKAPELRPEEARLFL